MYYGQQAGKLDYAAKFAQTNIAPMRVEIAELASNTPYYFVLQFINDCAAGPQSQVFQVNTARFFWQQNQQPAQELTSSLVVATPSVQQVLEAPRDLESKPAETLSSTVSGTESLESSTIIHEREFQTATPVQSSESSWRQAWQTFWQGIFSSLSGIFKRR
ncbi:hypothetical protein SDC9_82237 [bioreactor metagenome]|uniref:Fibronectin type-III domain-containing protein n=1 Tax=bioreactor metagenome TaxID=1076179 RepID=A0A644ZCN1_9ZZZZ